MLLYFTFAVIVAIPIAMAILRASAFALTESQFHRRCVDADRWMPRSEVEDRLEAGEGTLVIVKVEPDGAIREWWTPDNLIVGAPTPMPTVLSETQSDQIKAYAAKCWMKYIDQDAGLAMLTECAPMSTATVSRAVNIVTIFDWSLDGRLSPDAEIVQGRHVA